MHISVGTAQRGYGWIKKAAKPIWNRTVGRNLRESNALYLARTEREFWKPLADGLSYSLHLSSALSLDPNPVSRLLVRNDGTALVDRLEVCVVAVSGDLTYPEVAVVPFLEPGKIALIRLNRLPAQDIWWDNGIQATYDCVKVFPLSLIRAGKAEQCSSDVPIWHPTCDEFYNSHWYRQWGHLYNTDAIEEYKSYTAAYLWWYLCGRFDVCLEAQNQIAYWRWDSEDSVRLCFPLLEYHQLRFAPNVLLYWLLSNRLAVAAICWTALLLRLHVLRADYE
jgi:hypothetical protein